MPNFVELTRGTQKVLPVALERLKVGAIKVETIKLTNFTGTKMKVYNAVVRSSKGDKAYNVSLGFFNINKPTETQAEMSINRCGTRCACKSYYFWFSYPNMESKAHLGAKFKPYVRVTPPPSQGGRPKTNPLGIPGICKHIALLGNKLRRDGELK